MNQPSAPTSAAPPPCWAASLRLLPSLDSRALLWAAASGCQGTLLAAAAGHIGSRPGDEAERVSPDASGFKSVAQSAAATGEELDPRSFETWC